MKYVYISFIFDAFLSENVLVPTHLVIIEPELSPKACVWRESIKSVRIFADGYPMELPEGI